MDKSGCEPPSSVRHRRTWSCGVPPENRKSCRLQVLCNTGRIEKCHDSFVKSGHERPLRNRLSGDAKTFFSQDCPTLTRPSSSHLTTASSSFVRSTVPISPVGFPKLPKPSTRSPGFSSSSVAGGVTSGGRLARSESGVAPELERGDCGALARGRVERLEIGNITLYFPSEGEVC